MSGDCNQRPLLLLNLFSDTLLIFDMNTALMQIYIQIIVTMSAVCKIRSNYLPNHYIHESVKVMHRISYGSNPPSLYDLLYHNMERSEIDGIVRKPSVKHKSISASTVNNFINRGVFM